jgi:hypothetical protein
MAWPLLSKNFRKVERISAAFMGVALWCGFRP